MRHELTEQGAKVADVVHGGVLVTVRMVHEASVTRDAFGRWPRVRFRPHVDALRSASSYGDPYTCGPPGLAAYPNGDGAAAESAPIDDDGEALYCPVPGTLQVVGASGWTEVAATGRPVDRAAGGPRSTWTLTHEITPPEADNLPVQRGCTEIYSSANAVLVLRHGAAASTTLAVHGGTTLPVGPGVTAVKFARIDNVDLAIVRLRGVW